MNKKLKKATMALLTLSMLATNASFAANGLKLPSSSKVAIKRPLRAFESGGGSSEGGGSGDVEISDPHSFKKMRGNLKEQWHPSPTELSTVTIYKLMYKNDTSQDAIKNDGSGDFEWPEGVEHYDPTKYGEVEFSAYVIKNTRALPADKNAKQIAKDVETAVLNDTTLPYGAEFLKKLKITEGNMASFEDLQNDKNYAYVFVETKSSKFVKQKSEPMMIRLPMMYVDKETNKAYGYLETISLYPKNKVEELSFDFNKLGKQKGKDSTPLEGAKFKLYIGKPGNGKVVKDGEKDKIFTTDKSGKITLPDLIVGDYYLVEQEAEGKVDGMLKKIEAFIKRTDVGTFLAGGDAQNDIHNKLTFKVDKDGNITSPVANGYINYEKPEIEKTITNPNKAKDQTKDNYGALKDDKISFKVDFDIPENVGDYSKLGFKDELQKDGVKTDEVAYVNDSFVVKVDGESLVKDTDYTLDAKENSFVFEIKKDEAVINKLKGKNKITVVYDAKFKNPTQVVPDGNYTNKVDFTYNNSKFNNHQDRYDNKKKEFTTYGFKIKKVDGGVWGSGILNKPLEGAKFRLYPALDDGTIDDQNPLVEENGEIYFGNPYRKNNPIKPSNKDGIVEFKGLPAGVYYLAEIEAPKGYRLPDKENNVVKIIVGPNTYAKADIQQIENQPNDDLPMTGTEKTVLVLGALAGVTLVAGSVYVIKNKKEETAN